ncbi:AAA family ATPase [Kaistia dalseonensis]|uniref:Broad-specificity NMP kinase n=1 Tax=Kaistia dalseonensis TaxID=410840 RepID=A0ABU0H242_9HYPH|nr:AAA family ATPase [Kaistia dalseonensis]MCX5493805.1 AAA family ATPase [Kaistia dalseonensis]MDQ0436370.1 broad-specificity NMP kinase [Kaistia dalseonensis]
MGVRNYLIEGVSGSGKTSVASELQRRGHHVVHGDRELAYQGDPETGEPLSSAARDGSGGDVAFEHRHHIWDVDKVRSLVADQSHPITFFCGGSRNFHRFIGWFDDVFVLSIDPDTLESRLADRPHDEFGGTPEQRAFIRLLHGAQDNVPATATAIDATAPLMSVVDDILSRCRRGL